MTLGKLSVVVGGQFGSEAKGHVAGYLAKASTSTLNEDVIGVRVAGPNAGHTAYDAQGRGWALRQIPVPAVTNATAMLVVAAGSELDLGVLEEEIHRLEVGGFTIKSRLVIDGAATILTDDHHRIEGMSTLNARVGSTAKGIGACRIDRLMRTAATAWDLREMIEGNWPGVKVTPPGATGRMLMLAVNQGRHVIIEGTQGYGLGLHTPYYPQVTSSDCRAIDFLAMAGVSPWSTQASQLDVWVVFRPYPIRVAGNSGPLYGETSWEALGLPEERTTVTKKVRRVGRWDPDLAREAILANGGFSERGGAVRVAFAMADQVVPEVRGKTDIKWGTDFEGVEKLTQWIDKIEEAGAPVRLVLTGPDTEMEW